jgi:hypothetical protein
MKRATDNEGGGMFTGRGAFWKSYQLVRNAKSQTQHLERKQSYWSK